MWLDIVAFACSRMLGCYTCLARAVVSGFDVLAEGVLFIPWEGVKPVPVAEMSRAAASSNLTKLSVNIAAAFRFQGTLGRLCDMYNGWP